MTGALAPEGMSASPAGLCCDPLFRTACSFFAVEPLRCRFAVGRLRGSRDQLLQLSFNIRIAHMLVFQHAIGIDGKPVSYTHLDVYKRQHQDGGTPEFPTALGWPTAGQVS